MWRWGVAGIGRKHQRLADVVIDELLAKFRSGALEPGERLPPEPELAKQLGVSRGTLREATMELSRMGYLDVRQGAGTFVTVPDRRAVLRPFKTLLQIAAGLSFATGAASLAAMVLA